MIRAAMRQRLQSLTPQEREACAAAVFARVEALEPFHRAQTVAIYHALPDEVPTERFIAKWSAEKLFVLPCVEGDGLVFRRLCSATRRGPFGIEEPLGPDIDPSLIDFIIVPGVAFDISGHRLGRGRGYYDRFLEGRDLYKAGVCFPFQLLDSLPCLPHDQPMDIVLTE